jgi:signal transduction histidine kinase
MTSDTSHGLWVSVVNRGLLRLDDRRWDLPGSGLRLPEATPTALWTETAGRQWLGYAEGTAALRAGDSTQVFGPDQGLQVGPIMVIRGSPGEILVGGEWGLARFDGRRFRSLSASRSEAFSGISGIIVRANGDIWLNGNRGVVHMSSDALNDAYDHPLTKPRYDLFDVQDGLPGYAQQGEDASAVAAADGRLWFATNHGIAWIDPDHLIGNRIPPNVVIRSVGTGYFSAPVTKSTDGRLWIVADRNDVSIDATGQSTLPALTRDLQIEYTALSLVAPEKNRFRYKLEGYDRDWQDVGNRRQAFYTNLPPRNYRFRVIASNNSGVWNETGASLDFSIAPAYYQTTWFRALIAMAGLTLLWTAYQARVRRIAHDFDLRLDERVNERTRLARELHDTLLQTFHGVMFRFQAAVNMLPEHQTDVKEKFESAIDRAARAITEGRDAIQDLRASTVVSNDLAVAITTLGDELAASGANGKGTVVDVAVQGTPRDLHPILRDDIYRIAGEALRNAFRHADASRIEVKITYDDRQFRLQVRDDGKGIDAAALGDQRRGHFGLPGLRERADLVGGRLDVWSEVGAGTEIDLTIPAGKAYAAAGARRRAGWLHGHQ